MLTYECLAKRWSVTKKDVQNLVYAGKLKCHRITHKKTRFKPSDVEAYEKGVRK